MRDGQQGRVQRFWECQWRRAKFPECGLEVAVGLLMTHCQSHHGVGWGTPTVSFQEHLSQIQFPVAGFLGGAVSQTNLQIHFAHCHVRDTIVTLEEGNHLYHRCPYCNMFVPQKALNFRHPATAFCIRGMERKWNRLVEEEVK